MDEDDAVLPAAIALPAVAPASPRTPRRLAVKSFTSPAVRRAHAAADLPALSERARQRHRRRIARPRYLGRLSLDRGFVDDLLDVVSKYRLCRYCLQVVGQICEHSHPIEHDPDGGGAAGRVSVIPARALTACAGCNAAERESLRATCAQFGAHLRSLHVSAWPVEAQEFQSGELARRVTARKKQRCARASPLKRERAARILKFA